MPARIPMVRVIRRCSVGALVIGGLVVALPAAAQAGQRSRLVISVQADGLHLAVGQRHGARLAQVAERHRGHSRHPGDRRFGREDGRPLHRAAHALEHGRLLRGSKLLGQAIRAERRHPCPGCDRGSHRHRRGHEDKRHRHGRHGKRRHVSRH